MWDKFDDIICLDFETYFDSNYSLKNQDMSITQYIKDERFKIHTACLQSKKQKRGKWFTGKDIKKQLKAINWKRTALLAHHTQFEGLILSHHFNIKPVFMFDTLSMSRAMFSTLIKHDLDTLAKYLGFGGKVKGGVLNKVKGLRDIPPALLKQLGAYNVDDVMDTWKVFRAMMNDFDFPDEELLQIDLTVKMYTDPVIMLDAPRVEKELKRALKEEAKLFHDLHTVCGVEKQRKRIDTIELVKSVLRAKTPKETKKESRTCFPDVLRSVGIEPPLKISKKTGKLTYAFAKTDDDFTKLLDHKEKIIRDLVEAKLSVSSTINVTRAKRMLVHTRGGKDPLPIYLNYAGAHTLRWSGGDKLNPQNFPARGRNGNELRKSLLAPHGHYILVIDSAQIEARVLAWLAGQWDLVEAFARDEDVYSDFASTIFGYEVNKKGNVHERFIGKQCILGLGYSMGWARLLEQILGFDLVKEDPDAFEWLDEDEAKRMVKIYRGKYTNIKALWRTLDRLLKTTMFDGGIGPEELGPLVFDEGEVRLPNGLSLHYPELQVHSRGATYWDGEKHTKIYGGLLTENIVQCLSKIIIGEQLTRISECYRVATTTHDEGVIIVPEKKIEKAMDFCMDIFRTPPEWGLEIPLNAEAGYDVCYSK